MGRHSGSASFLFGFTLLEVMISLAMLSTLLAVIIQSNTELTFFLHRTGRLSIAQKVVINELMRLERENSETLSSREGTFPLEHELAGSKWKLIVTDMKFLGVAPVTRIRYQVSWFVGEQENTYESSFLR